MLRSAGFNGVAIYLKNRFRKGKNKKELLDKIGFKCHSAHITYCTDVEKVPIAKFNSYKNS